MGADDMEECFGRDIFGEEEVSGEGFVCRLPSGSPPGRNSGDGGDPRESVKAGERAVAHDGGPSLLAAIVGGFFEHHRSVSFAWAREATFHIGKELSLILLERQHVMAAAVEDRLCEGTAAEKRVPRDDFALEPQHLKDFQSRLGFVSAGRLAGGQRQAGLGRKDVDHMQGRGAFAPLVGPAQRLAVDRDDAIQVQLVEAGERRHEALEHSLEAFRIEHAEKVAEHVVARHPFLERQKTGAASLSCAGQSPPCPWRPPPRTAQPPKQSSVFPATDTKRSPHADRATL